MVMAFVLVACLIFFDVVINPFPVHPYCQGLYLEYVIFISVQQSGKMDIAQTEIHIIG